MNLQISFGPIAWLMIGEIFPLNVRGQAIAVCTLTNFGTNFVVSPYCANVRRHCSNPAWALPYTSRRIGCKQTILPGKVE